MVTCNDMYGGTNRFFRRVVMERHKVEVSFVEATDPKEVEKAIKPNTKMVSKGGIQGDIFDWRRDFACHILRDVLVVLLTLVSI